MDATEIQSKLNYCEPLMLMDRVSDLKLDEEITAQKSVSANEAYFQGHFPHNPVMPGVLLIETMVEAAQLMWDEPSLTLTKVKHGRFREMVKPGMQLTVKLSAQKQYACEAEVLVGEKKACTAELEFKVAE
ncbi:MAG: beta-hydroxyacyl-ACP dehydratase [Lactobacillus sp.]|nr:beta-hydroxyacyl-ACP dehydratase [Lactobacillus sp.]